MKNLHVRSEPKMARTVLVVSVAFAVVLMGPVPAASARPGGKLVPSSGLLLGSFVGWAGDAYAIDRVAQRESQIGRPYAINHHFYSWTNPFPTALEADDAANGRIPLISWEAPALGSIVNGSQDSLIRDRARRVKAYVKPVFLRWAWEMNGAWSTNTYGYSAAYRSAWQRIHRLFAAEGAKNVAWVWAPNVSSTDNWSPYYPGDSYVDWVGIDGYNWGTTQWWSRWTTFSQVFGGGVYAAYAGRKPIMISETASTEQGGNKASWLDALRTEIPKAFPAVAAIVYFDVAKETSWQVDSSPDALAAWRRTALAPYFGARL